MSSNYIEYSIKVLSEDKYISYDPNDNVIYYEDFDISGKWILEDLGSDYILLEPQLI